MVEQKALNVIGLSERWNAVSISMTLAVDFGPLALSLGVQGPTMLSVDEPMEKLWSDGLHAGVVRAVHEVVDILAATGIYVEIRDLEISARVDALDEAELGRLIDELEDMSYRTLYPILSEKARRRPNGH